MEPSYDNAGFLTKVKGKFGYSREVTLTKWNEKLYVHINDNSKCWDNGAFDKTKAKSILLNWKNASSLKDCLKELETFASQMETELLHLTSHLRARQLKVPALPVNAKQRQDPRSVKSEIMRNSVKGTVISLIKYCFCMALDSPLHLLRDERNRVQSKTFSTTGCETVTNN